MHEQFHFTTLRTQFLVFFLNKEFFIIFDCVRYFNGLAIMGIRKQLNNCMIGQKGKRYYRQPRIYLKDLLCLASKEYTLEGRKVVLRADGPKEFGTNWTAQKEHGTFQHQDVAGASHHLLCASFLFFIFLRNRKMQKIKKTGQMPWAAVRATDCK